MEAAFATFFIAFLSNTHVNLDRSNDRVVVNLPKQISSSSPSFSIENWLKGLSENEMLVSPCPSPSNHEMGKKILAECSTEALSGPTVAEVAVEGSRFSRAYSGRRSPSSLVTKSTTSRQNSPVSVPEEEIEDNEVEKQDDNRNYVAWRGGMPRHYLSNQRSTTTYSHAKGNEKKQSVKESTSNTGYGLFDDRNPAMSQVTKFRVQAQSSNTQAEGLKEQPAMSPKLVQYRVDQLREEGYPLCIAKYIVDLTQNNLKWGLPSQIALDEAIKEEKQRCCCARCCHWMYAWCCGCCEKE